MAKHVLFHQSLSEMINEFFREELKDQGEADQEALTAEEVAALDGSLEGVDP